MPPFLIFCSFILSTSCYRCDCRFAHLQPVRELAGHALGALVGSSSDAPAYIVKINLPSLVDSVYKTPDLCERHGSMWAISDVLLALASLKQVGVVIFFILCCLWDFGLPLSTAALCFHVH